MWPHLRLKTSPLYENEPASSRSLASRVVPADLKLFYLFSDALCYFPAAGYDQPPRHQVKRATWMGKADEQSAFCCRSLAGKEGFRI